VDLKAPGDGVAAQQRLVGQRQKLAQRDAGHALPGLAREAAAKHRQLKKHVLAGLVEPRPGGFDHRAHAALAVGDVSHLGFEEVQAGFDLVRDLLGREHIDPGRRQHDSERQPGHAPQMRATCGRSGAPMEKPATPARAELKKADRRAVTPAGLPGAAARPGLARRGDGWHVDPAQDIDRLGVERQALARGDQQLDPGRGFEDLGDQSRAAQEVLKIVQHDQQFFFAQKIK